jgi:hypothetical protein
VKAPNDLSLNSEISFLRAFLDIIRSRITRPPETLVASYSHYLLCYSPARATKL